MTVRNFDVVSGKFNIVEICTRGKYKYKWNTTWWNH